MPLLALRSWSIATRLVIAVFLVATAAFAWVFVNLVAGMPNRDELRAFRVMPSATVLYDVADREVFAIAKEHRIEVPLAEVSPNLIKAVIAVEDRRFFDHDGFDPIRIAGSALADLRAGAAAQGGSTITQQLARQAVGRQKTLQRKVRELLFAAQLERHFTKNEILELYLNKVYFGDGLYGAEAAARGYFAKRASALTLAEGALLAGLLKAPSNYAPTVNAERSESRQAIVLKSMLDSKAITKAEYEGARMACVAVRGSATTTRKKCDDNWSSASAGRASLKAAFTCIPPSIPPCSAPLRPRSIAASRKLTRPCARVPKGMRRCRPR